MTRYLKPDGIIDFDFIRDMRLGLVPGPRSNEEQEVLAAYFYGGGAGVVRHLASTGEIEVEAVAGGAGSEYRAYLEDRRRQRSANGKGRRTHGG